MCGTFSGNACQHVTSHQQRFRTFDLRYKRSGPRHLNSSFTTSHSAWIDDANPSANPTANSSVTKDWIFLSATYQMDAFDFCPVVPKNTFSLKFLCILWFPFLDVLYTFFLFLHFEDLIVLFLRFGALLHDVN